MFFFFQAEDGIRDLVRSRGLGDVYKRQPEEGMSESVFVIPDRNELSIQVRQKLKIRSDAVKGLAELCLSLIHI